MEDIMDKIKDFKKLLNVNIDLNLFNKLVSHCTDGHIGAQISQYANNLDVEEWKKLFEKVNIDVTTNQIIEFFEYMQKHYNKYFSKINAKTYAVNRYFNKNLIDNFEFESIVYYSINL